MAKPAIITGDSGGERYWEPLSGPRDGSDEMAKPPAKSDQIHPIARPDPDWRSRQAIRGV